MNIDNDKWLNKQIQTIGFEMDKHMRIKKETLSAILKELEENRKHGEHLSTLLNKIRIEINDDVSIYKKKRRDFIKNEYTKFMKKKFDDDFPRRKKEMLEMFEEHRQREQYSHRDKKNDHLSAINMIIDFCSAYSGGCILFILALEEDLERARTSYDCGRRSEIKTYLKLMNVNNISYEESA